MKKKDGSEVFILNLHVLRVLRAAWLLRALDVPGRLLAFEHRPVPRRAFRRAREPALEPALVLEPALEQKRVLALEFVEQLERQWIATRTTSELPGTEASIQ